MRSCTQRRTVRLQGRCSRAIQAIQHGLKCISELQTYETMCQGGPRTGVQIHRNIGQVQLRDRVVGALQIRILGVGTLGHIQVGNQVGQAVRFCKLLVLELNRLPPSKFQSLGVMDLPMTKMIWVSE